MVEIPLSASGIRPTVIGRLLFPGILAMKPNTSLVLRLLGPLIELPCAMLLMRSWGRGETVLGIPVEYPLIAGLAAGLLMVIAGLTLVKRVRPVRGPLDDDRPRLL